MDHHIKPGGFDGRILLDSDFANNLDQPKAMEASDDDFTQSHSSLENGGSSTPRPTIKYAYSAHTPLTSQARLANAQVYYMGDSVSGVLRTVK